jgi:hypothetical protein
MTHPTKSEPSALALSAQDRGDATVAFEAYVDNEIKPDSWERRGPGDVLYIQQAEREYSMEEEELAFFAAWAALIPMRERERRLMDLMEAAVARVQIANEQGDPILSAWLIDARQALKDTE